MEKSLYTEYSKKIRRILMGLERLSFRVNKKQISLDIGKYEKLIGDLRGFPNSERYFNALHEESMNLLSECGKSHGFFFRDKYLYLEGIFLKKICEFRLEYFKKFLSDILIIYVKGNFSEFNGSVGLSRERNITEFYPHQMIVAELDGKVLEKYTYSD